MKKKMKVILACLCVFALLATSFSFAVEDQPAEDIVRAGVPQAATKTVTDSHGNRYRVAGASYILGKRAETRTSFEVTNYYGGKKTEVDGYTKKLTGIGRVWFSSGASYNEYNKTANRSGAEGEYIAKDSYDFFIRTMLSTHKFSCQGGSGNFNTEM